MTIYRGASFILTITVQDADGFPVDLTGATVRAQVHTRAAKSSAMILDLAPAITDAVNGVITINRSAAVTAVLEPQSGVWDLMVTTAAGDTLLIVPTEEITISALATPPV